ncbi:MAG TPA: hypothetical protein DCY93_02450 [Firmicutes bacterium]|nr:hypothetical protein [Bacillota bacterium]
MPELPEVETVKNTLIKDVLGKRITGFSLLYKRIMQTELGLEETVNKTIIDIKRHGKFLIINLEDNVNMVLHLRMEGKIFYFKEEIKELPKSTSFVLNLDQGYLYFFDTRKFAVCYVFKGDDYFSLPPLSLVGPDPFLAKKEDIYNSYKKDKRPVKEILMDQHIMSGIGNIYADEILFSCALSPFILGTNLEEKDVENIILSAQKILRKSIELGGSTVKSYQSSANHSGSFQDELKVYGRAGEKCFNCSSLIEKRSLSGRGTSFCPKCQKHGNVIALTGSIGSGKSSVAQIFVNHGYLLYDCDKKVKEFYQDKKFISEIEKKFKDVFKGGFNKDVLLSKMTSSPSFRRKYENYIFHYIKEDINSYLIENYSKNIIVEVPRFFDANLKLMIPRYILVRADKKIRYNRLIKRGQKNIDEMLKLEKDLDKKKIEQAFFIIDNDGDKINLENKVKEIISYIEEEKK